MHALLGENGAGKSTLMGVASGSIAPDAGTIAIAGQQVDAWNPDLAPQNGLAIVYQHPALLPDLTVAENIAIALPEQIARRAGRERRLDARAARPGRLRGALNARVEELSVAQRQLLELAKALALDPQILILDEPTAPLGADMVERVFEQVRAAAARDAAVVYISHRLPEVREIADVVTVMRDGEAKATRADRAISDDEILQLIIGRTVEPAYPPKATSHADGDAPVLAVDGLSGRRASRTSSLEVRPGEIVGLAGIAGNGQSEFLRALAGLERVSSGQVSLNGTPLKLGRPRAARKRGRDLPVRRSPPRGPADDALGARERRAGRRCRACRTCGVVRRARRTPRSRRSGTR